MSQDDVNDHGGKLNGKRLQGTPDARKRPANYTPVCEQAADKADGVPCDRLQDDDYAKRLQTTTRFLQSQLKRVPEVVTILGSGQDALPEDLAVEGIISYQAIPHFPQPTAPGHSGQLIHGRIGATACLFLQGRCHHYEGYEAAEITLPLRAIAQLGVKVLLITNTAGGLKPSLGAGDLMAITDQLNFIGANPLRGPHCPQWGPRFPDMTEAYPPRLLAIADQAARRLGIDLKHGVYVAVPGPSLETPAEVRFLRQAGGDAVGMSTAPEVIDAVQAGLEVFGLSVIANANCPGGQRAPILVADILAQVKQAAKTSSQLLQEIILNL